MAIGGETFSYDTHVSKVNQKEKNLKDVMAKLQSSQIYQEMEFTNIVP